MKELLAAGGARKALSWLVSGMTVMSPALMNEKPTRGSFVQNLLLQGMTAEFAEKMAALAASDGQLASEDGVDELDLLPPIRREEAEHEAVDIAMALAEGHISTSSLANSPDVEEILSARYEDDYPAACSRAGLVEIDLVERFPVLNVMYGYTRGGGEAAESRLIPFRHPRGGYRLYGDLSETEALYFRLDPISVAKWLFAHGHVLPGWSPTNQDQRQARIAIIEAVEMPPPGDEPAIPSVGSDLLTLIHSYSHRVIRRTSVFAGIDRDALAEYLVPINLGFFIYAASRGDFVLGGLQAVFETDLDSLLTNVVYGEHRCALDPGCSRGAGACLACLHVGEPSCRYFNTFLDRNSLFSKNGYFNA